MRSFPDFCVEEIFVELESKTLDTIFNPSGESIDNLINFGFEFLDFVKQFCMLSEQEYLESKPYFDSSFDCFLLLDHFAFRGPGRSNLKYQVIMGNFIEHGRLEKFEALKFTESLQLKRMAKLELIYAKATEIATQIDSSNNLGATESLALQNELQDLCREAQVHLEFIHLVSGLAKVSLCRVREANEYFMTIHNILQEYSALKDLRNSKTSNKVD